MCLILLNVSTREQSTKQTNKQRYSYFYLENGYSVYLQKQIVSSQTE